MKVKNYSFKVHEGPISLTDFFTFIADDDKESYSYNGLTRLLYVKQHDAYFTGMIVSPKDHKTYLAIQRQGERLTIKANEIEDGSQLCDFNIFIINPKMAQGVYTHYHGGMSLDTLDGYFNRFYKRCKRKTIQKDRKIVLLQQGLDEDEIERILDDECREELKIFPMSGGRLSMFNQWSLAIWERTRRPELLLPEIPGTVKTNFTVNICLMLKVKTWLPVLERQKIC